MAQDTAEAGIDFQTNSHASDIEVWVDNGEFAVVWALKRVQDDDGNDTDLVEERKYYCEAGDRDEIGGADVFEEDRTVEQYARQELLNEDSEELVKAKDYWR